MYHIYRQKMVFAFSPFFYYSPLPIKMAWETLSRHSECWAVQRSAQKKKENVNHKDERELQKVIFLKLPQPQNVHKSSQISTMSMPSTKINLPEESDSKTWVRNEAQYTVEPPLQEWGGQSSPAESTEHCTARLSCCWEIPVRLQESV